VINGPGIKPGRKGQQVPENSSLDISSVPRSKLSYGWVIVLVCTISVAISYGILYSYSVFFKPIVASFNWDRATVSSIYSVLLVSRGATSIGIGWLADKYGPRKVSVLCGFLIGVGLILTSRVHELWQLYLAFGLVEAVGLGGAFTVGTSITTQWFTKNRGLALGIVSSGSGLGTLIMELAHSLLRYRYIRRAGIDVNLPAAKTITGR
jgi:MFS family permease